MTTADIAALDPRRLSVGMVRRWARDLAINDPDSAIAEKLTHSSSHRPASYARDEVKDILEYGLGPMAAEAVLKQAKKTAEQPKAPEKPKPQELNATAPDQVKSPVRDAIRRIVTFYGMAHGDVQGSWVRLYDTYERIYHTNTRAMAQVAGLNTINYIESMGGLLDLLFLASCLFGGIIKAA